MPDFKLDALQADLLQDCLRFVPELILCLTIVFLLVLRLFSGFNRMHLGGTTLGLTALAFLAAWYEWNQAPLRLLDNLSTGTFVWVPLLGGGAGPSTPAGLFTGLLVYDGLTVYLRLFLLASVLLIVWLSLLTGIPDREDSADFYVLLLGATLGMSLMASANHLLLVYIGVEMASLPSYGLAGFLKGRRQSSEAALKYVVYGGGASGVMLYGISLLAGKFGTAYLPEVAQGFIATLGAAGQGTLAGYDPVLLLATMLILVGIAFKLAAVPFHFWCPDVFEGAAAEVAAFLSVASKGAALALLARVLFTFSGLSQLDGVSASWTHANWLSAVKYLAPSIAVFAGLTATFGNLAAYLQTNLKRLLAYSTIAHAGYMMMGLATMTRDGLAAVLFYLVTYLLMNVGAFAIVAFLRNKTGSEDLMSFRGLVQRSPLLVVTLGIFLLSLLGIPPLAGFIAKFQIFKALYEAGQFYSVDGYRGLSSTMYILLVVGGINTVISAVYYVRVLKVMILDLPIEEIEGVSPPPLKVSFGTSVYAFGMALAVLLTGIFWGPLATASGLRTGVASQFRAPPPLIPPPMPTPAAGS